MTDKNDKKNLQRAIYFVNYYQTHVGDSQEAHECFEWLLAKKKQKTNISTNKVEKIRKEIERRKKEYCNGLDSVAELYDSLLSFIDSLQEEPVSEKLEKAALLYYQIMPRISEPHGVIPADTQSHYLGDANQDKREGFIDGAKWQKDQMMKDAMEIPFDFDTINATLKYKQGKKIKLIIIKE